jgi:hypothetical protein
MCRECIRPPGWEERVSLLKDNTHFIFSVESTGAMPARSLVLEAIRILASKASDLLAVAGGDGGAVPVMGPSKAALHSSAAMQSPEDEEN